MNVHHIQKGIINHTKDIDVDKKINLVISNKNIIFDIIKYMGGSFSGKTIDSDSVNDGSTPSPSTNFIVKQKKTFPIRCIIEM